MALVDALLPYLEEEERRKRMLAASEESTPVATPEFARALIGKGPKPPVKPAPGVTPPPPPEAITEEPPTLRSRNYAVPEPALGASPVMTPEGEAGLEAASVNPEPNLQMPDFSGATAGPVTGGKADAYDQYMIENQRLHGTAEHKGWGNRFKHALQGAGIGALQSIGDAWKSSGGRGTFADLLGAGAGGAAGGGAAGAYSPKSIDSLYNRLYVEPEAQRQAEKARISQKEAVEQKKDELGLQKLAQDIEAAKVDLANAPDEAERKRQELKIKQKMLELDERRIVVSERPDYGYSAETGRSWNKTTGVGKQDLPPMPSTSTAGQPHYYPGSTDMQRVRQIAEEEIKALPNNAGNVEWIAQTSADGDPGGVERKLAGMFLGDANLAKQTLEEWKNYQKPAAPLTRPPSTASPEEQAAYQEKVKASVAGGDSADRARRAEVAKYVEEARKQLLDEKRRGAELNYRRMVEERVQQFLQRNYTGGATPPTGGNDRTQGSLPGYGKGKGKATGKKNLGTEDERAYDPDYGKIGLK
jgi:hypothetical protein